MKIMSVTIPKNVGIISDGVFHDCTGLETVTISSNADIERNCFADCSSLTSVDFTLE